MVQYQAELDVVFSALSDANRRMIIDRLVNGPAAISELAAICDMSLTGLKKHVRVLEEADLVATVKKGRVRECRLGDSDLDAVAGWIDWYQTHWRRRLDQLERLVEQKEQT